MANEDWAKDPKTRPEVLAMLSTSPSEAVRLLVAQNVSTPETALLHLARDENDQVRKAVINRSHVSSEVLQIATLPRELLNQQRDSFMPTAQVGQDQAFEALEPLEITAPVLDLPPLIQTELLPKKPSLFGWFWRLFGRNAS